MDEMLIKYVVTGLWMLAAMGVTISIAAVGIATIVFLLAGIDVVLKTAKR